MDHRLTMLAAEMRRFVGVLNQMLSKVRQPITFNGRNITNITLRRPLRSR